LAEIDETTGLAPPKFFYNFDFLDFSSTNPGKTAKIARWSAVDFGSALWRR
jgi:hypothetical protein